MAEKKESYSEEELNEMIVWFNNHADELPKEMQINKAAFTPDLKLTVESCIMQANFFYFLICCLSPIYIFRFRLMLKQC